MLESTVEAYFELRAKLAGGECRKLKWIGRRHAPDRFFALGGRVYLVELKRPGAEPRAGQEREHARLRAVGVDVRVIDTLKDVDDFFEEVERP